MAKSGALVFYRWPPTISTLDEAPQECQVFLKKSDDILRYGIHQGHHRGKQNSDPWIAEKRTACAYVYCDKLNEEEFESLDDWFKPTNVKECRFDKKDTPSSIVAWMPGGEKLDWEDWLANQLVDAENIPDLNSFLDKGYWGLIQATNDCVELMGTSMKKK